MPIYSNLYSNLARQGFAKSFIHGYAQSVVAATHPASYPNQPNRSPFARRPSRLGKLGNHQFQNAFYSCTSSANAAAREGRQEKFINNDSGLEAYFDAWKKQHAPGEPEKEWTQFQFAKRIEWKPVSTVVEHKEKEKDHAADSHPERRLERSYSTGAIDDLNDVHKIIAESSVLKPDDDAVSQDIVSIASKETSAVSRAPTPPIAPVQSPALPVDGNFIHSQDFDSTATTAALRLQSQSYADHLTKLSTAGRYAEIPAVFEAMLVAGIKPIASAYNALLSAAIHIPTERIQVVPKALDVYSDMLRRKVLPDATTYDILINLLASRSIEVSTLIKSLDEKRTRFGGMEEGGKFMLASSEVEHAILSEDDRLGLAIRLFNDSVASRRDGSYPAETYLKLIIACAGATRIPDMVRVYEHMESNKVIPFAATFPPMIQGFTKTGDLVSAVECYNEYKALAISHDNGMIEIADRQDAIVYASVIKAYVELDKLEGAIRFYKKIMSEYGSQFEVLRNHIIARGFVEGMIARDNLPEAMGWAEGLEPSARAIAMSKIAAVAADRGQRFTATSAFGNIPLDFNDIATPATALMAMCVREGDVAAASRYWQVLSSPHTAVTSAFIEPTAMYAVALIGSGQVAEGLLQADQMFTFIKETASDTKSSIVDEVEEGVEFISKFMADRGITDPRTQEVSPVQSDVFSPASAPSASIASFENTFDPYAALTDFKGSTLIADELEKGSSARGTASRLNEALLRFCNIRRAGRHPRYVTYAKLISAAARENKMQLVLDILGMARTDVPVLMQYQTVKYGWTSILDAMVGACLTLGKRKMAAQYHQELLDIGSAPTANTFGLYITTLKESTKTFDEASEAVSIFHRAKSEGVEPTSFLYNALIGKLGKARRIDDCLYYFAEMRSLGIRPTSVTYGTIVNALCRVSDEKFAEELFEEMESMPNYKARPAPYNSLMQFFLITKRDKSKVLSYYERMKSNRIEPTNHTYKLLIDAHATLEPINMAAAEAVLDVIRSKGQSPEAIHYASLIHAKGCVLHDMDGALIIFNSVLSDLSIRPQACLYQALFEAFVANHRVAETEPILKGMYLRGVEMTPYIANTLIHGWANEMNIEKSKEIFASVSQEKREPSTYEAMTRAYLTVEDRQNAKAVVKEMLSRGYPSAVSSKIIELVGGGNAGSWGETC